VLCTALLSFAVEDEVSSLQESCSQEGFRRDGTPCIKDLDAELSQRQTQAQRSDVGNDLGESALPTGLEQFSSNSPATVLDAATPVAPTHDVAAERSAENVGRMDNRKRKPAKPQKKKPLKKTAKQKIARPASHENDHIETATTTPAPGSSDGPGDDAGPVEQHEEHAVLGEFAEVSEGSRMAACEARAAAPCGGNGQYVMLPAAQGLTDVTCRCNTGWAGPDCKAKCPVVKSSDGAIEECAGNGKCRFHVHPYMGASCDCKNSWTGKYCQQCKLDQQCANQGFPDTSCSRCQCRNRWEGEHCTGCGLKCAHGAEPDDNCAKCNCKLSWVGESCDKCGLHNKCNHGEANADCSGCKCKGNWTGARCNKCGIQCQNGVPNHSCTGCVCENEWTGKKCDQCPLKRICRNRAVPSKTCDSCVCKKGTAWKGSLCHVCGLVCINGAPSPACEQCKCVGNWGGQLCDTCKLPCVNGEPDPFCKRCVCPGGWSGAACTTCKLKCPESESADSTCTRCIAKNILNQRHSLAFDGDSNVVTLHNRVKGSDTISTIDLKFKALQLSGRQGLICDREQVSGSVCIQLVHHKLAISIFGNHITAHDPVISGSTQMFSYMFKPFTGYEISVVYGLLPKGMAYTKLYVDGKAVDTKFFATGVPARLGAALVGGLQSQSNDFFEGFIDHLRIWNIPRMAWAIKKDMNRQLVGVEQGLLAYFPFNNPVLKAKSLGLSQWEMEVHGAVYSEPFSLGRRQRL